MNKIEETIMNQLEENYLNEKNTNLKKKQWLRQNVSGSFSKEMTLCNQLIDKYRIEIKDNTQYIQELENIGPCNSTTTIKNTIKRLKDENDCYHNCVKKITVMRNTSEKKREKIFYITHDDDMSYDVYKDALTISMSS